MSTEPIAIEPIDGAAADQQLVADLFDAVIDAHLATLEATIRHDMLLTGPEHDDVLDAPSDPDADWQRVTVEEILLLERAELERWRDRALAASITRE